MSEPFSWAAMQAEEVKQTLAESNTQKPAVVDIDDINIAKGKSSYEEGIRAKLQFEIPFDIDNWYEDLKEFTFHTRFLLITVLEAKAIRNQYKLTVLKNYHADASELTQQDDYKAALSALE